MAVVERDAIALLGVGSAPACTKLLYPLWLRGPGHVAWSPIVAMNRLPWLEAIDPDWDLLLLPGEHWQPPGRGGSAARGLPRNSAAQFSRLVLGSLVVTKVLHTKRPRLMPVLDSLVPAQVSARASDDPRSWVAGVERVGEGGRANLEAREAIDRHLGDGGINPKDLVRILDTLLWTSSSTAGHFSRLDGLERVLRPPGAAVNKR